MKVHAFGVSGNSVHSAPALISHFHKTQDLNVVFVNFCKILAKEIFFLNHENSANCRNKISYLGCVLVFVFTEFRGLDKNRLHFSNLCFLFKWYRGSGLKCIRVLLTNFLKRQSEEQIKTKFMLEFVQYFNGCKYLCIGTQCTNDKITTPTGCRNTRSDIDKIIWWTLRKL